MNQSPASAGTVFDGPEEVSLYTFLMIRRALQARVMFGLRVLKGREIEAARNHGWTEARTAKQALEDLNTYGADVLGLEKI